MEKEIYRRHLTRGCVWVFMSMFDFKHGGGSNQKLLMDKKLGGSKRIIDLETKACDCEESESEMQSVKKLIEEETTKARNRKRRRSRTYSKTSEDINVLDVINDVDDDEDHAERRASDYDSEEKFSELIKRLIAQKESEIEIRKSYKKKNLLDAFQELDESKEVKETIVILKPDSPDLDDVSKENKNKNGGRFGSWFLLSRIRRRLKKSPCNVIITQQEDSDQEQDQDQDALSQNHNIEANNVLDTTINGGEGGSKKKSMCGIYIAAKKHLSEMLAEGDIDVDLSDKESPRILGKILALPEFSTPENSPRTTQDFIGFKVTEKPKITSELDSYKHEETIAFTSDIGVSDNEKKEEEEKIVLDSLVEAICSSVIQEDAYVDEDEDEHKQEQETTFNEKHSQSSPPRNSECQEIATDVPGKSSPVSVLEPFFTDDELSPNSSSFSSSVIVERRLQPLCIRFEEPESPRPNKTRMDDKELTLEYIEAIVKSSELNWEEILSRSFYSHDQLLEQALMEDIDFCSNNFCEDKKLLFDCINEVLNEFCKNGPWISFVKPAMIENVVEVVQEEVCWYLLPLPSPHTLDQIVKKDLASESGSRRRWMDLRFDIGFIGFEIGEVILDELLEEMIQ